MKTLMVLLCLILLAGCSKPPSTVRETETLHLALGQYATNYGVYPTGDTVAIMQALKGANAQHVVFIEFPPAATAPDGTWLDPWGTSYRVDYPAPDSIRVTSAGPDRKFDTGDDIQSVHPSVLPSPSR